jgi:hypothetical protein
MRSSFTSLYKKTIAFLALISIFGSFASGLTWMGLVILSICMGYLLWKQILAGEMEQRQDLAKYKIKISSGH